MKKGQIIPGLTFLLPVLAAIPGLTLGVSTFDSFKSLVGILKRIVS